MLPNAARKDERVEAAERACKRAQFPPNAVDEQINRLFGGRPSLASNVRMSLDRPETPSKPDRS